MGLGLISAYAVTAGGYEGFGLVRLRTRAVRYVLVAVGVISLATLYVMPTVSALVLPSPPSTLPALSLPLPWFPPLTAPKLHAVPTVPKVRPIPKTHAPARTPVRTQKKQGHRVHVPVARTSYSVVPPSQETQTPATASYASSPVVDALAAAIASAPVVTDQTGTPEAVTPNASDASGTIDESVGSMPTTLAPGSTTTPDAVVDPSAIPAQVAPPDDRAADATADGTPAPQNDVVDPAAVAATTAHTNSAMISNAEPPQIASATVTPATVAAAPANDTATDDSVAP